MKGIPTPQPVKDLIIDRIKNGERVDDVAKEFGLYPNTLRKWLNEASMYGKGGRGGRYTGLNSNTNEYGKSTSSNRSQSDILTISKLQREKQELLEIIGELTVLTKQSKKKSGRSLS